jgi:asparagine synthase (glutamine-hydrolysing)
VRLHEELAEADVADLLPRLVKHLDAPFADTSAAPTWLLCAAARRHVTVALSGDGGDENFAGYRRTRLRRARAALARASAGRAAARRARATGARLAGGAGRPAAAAGRHAARQPGEDWLGAYVTSMSRVRESTARELLRPGLVDAAPLRADFEAHAARCDGLDPLHRVLALDFATWLPDDILVRSTDCRWRTGSRCGCRCSTPTS